MAGFDPLVFRRYDIRGRAGETITDELAYAVGRGLGTRIRRAGGDTAAVGRDVRHSSPALLDRAARGLADAGVDVTVLGQVPTPVVYHALHRLGLGGGIVVTGSHNPRSDNGLKLCLGTGPFWGQDIEHLRTLIAAADYERGDGTLRERDYLAEYEEEICRSFAFERRFRVVVDCGNGVMGPTVLRTFERLGLEVTPLYCEPDGDFPGHLPDPEVPAYMAELGRTVVATGADCGLGFDGDGDRVGVFDETGRKISADWLLALFARDLLAREPGGKVRYDVKCTDFLDTDIRAHGGVPLIGETGHSILKRDVVAEDALLGGELSGHIVFNRGYLPIDDALYCALAFLRLVERAGGPPSGLFADFPELVSTAEIKVPCPDADKFRVVSELAGRFRNELEVLEIDGARVRLADGSWFLVRASNTTPNLTVRFEGPTHASLEQARQILLRGLREHPEATTTPLESTLETH